MQAKTDYCDILWDSCNLQTRADKPISVIKENGRKKFFVSSQKESFVTFIEETAIHNFSLEKFSSKHGMQGNGFVKINELCNR